MKGWRDEGFQYTFIRVDCLCYPVGDGIGGHLRYEPEHLKAQVMIMELSKLMRNVHYEGIPRTPLCRETDFIASYVELMRKRYPNRKVHISLEVPEGNRKRVSLPPCC